MAPGKVNINGTWQDVAEVSAKVNGAWKTVTEGYNKVNGTWQQWFSSQSEAHELITSVTLSGTSTTITGISGDYDQIHVIGQYRINTDDRSIRMKVNGQTANYAYAWTRGFGTVVQFDQGYSQSSQTLPPADTSGSIIELFFDKPFDTSKNVFWNGRAGRVTGNGDIAQWFGGSNDNIQSLSSITFETDRNFESDSVISIYGIRGA